MMLGFASVLGEMAIYHLKQTTGQVQARELYTQVVILSVPLSAGIPVFFYLYVKSALRLESSFQRSDFLHLLVPIIYLVLILPFALLELADKYAFYQDIQQGKDMAWPLIVTPTRYTRLATAAVLGIFYLQLCWHELHREINLKKQDILKTAKHLKRNYRVMSLGIAIIFLFLMIRLPIEMTWTLSIVLILMALASSWLFIKLPEMGHDRSAKTKGTGNTEKQYRSSVTEQMANQSMKTLTQLMATGIYKDSTLSLGKLASQMEVSNHHLSQIINQQYQGSYYDLIHKYRINEAKRLLLETSFSIADITYEVGYNSKSVFYTEFKRQTQLTPSQYKKSTALAL